MPLAASWTASAFVYGIIGSGFRTLFRGAGSELNGHHPVIIPMGTSELGTWKNFNPPASQALHFFGSSFNVSTLTSGAWHQITAVGNGTTTAMYIDGQYVGTSAFKSNTNIYAIGNYQGGGQRFSAMIDEIYMYNRGTQIKRWPQSPHHRAAPL